MNDYSDKQWLRRVQRIDAETQSFAEGVAWGVTGTLGGVLLALLFLLVASS